MTFNYYLDQNDYLQHQLFSASKTYSVKKQRSKSWLICSITVVLVSLLFYQHTDSGTAVSLGFALLALLAILYYPVYLGNRYRHHYLIAVTENYAYRFGKRVDVAFTDDTIELHDITGHSSLHWSALKNVTETGDYFFPALKSGGHLIVPKRQIENVSTLRQELQVRCKRLGIPFIDEINWKWR